MIYIKNFDNEVQSTILKINNIIFIFIKKKFANISVKNSI